MEKLIGRNTETELLSKFMESERSEFIALYGRRRVGKTFLIRSFFKDNFDFYVTGMLGGKKEDEMEIFIEALRKYGYKGPKPESWMKIFACLGDLLETKKRKKRCVVFIDELPCFDTQHSGFVNAFGHFWNSRASWMDNIFLIVCGSATSWMIRNIINNHGGLHNRITHSIHLKPFNLAQTESYLKSKKSKWTRLSILQAYMSLGGIPYYLSLLDCNLSIAENIDNLFFKENAELAGEYKRLYQSLYRNPDRYMDIIELLSEQKHGLTRTEISNKLKISSGSHLSDMLDDLVYCDFVRKYKDGTKLNSAIYQLVDFFTLFYLKFCNKGIVDQHFWCHSINTPTQNNWYGLAYERVCLFHIQEIIKSLHLDTMHTDYYSWRSKNKTDGAQIDIVIDRADNIINICEVKYSKSDYLLTKNEYVKIQRRISSFEEEMKESKGLQTVLITTFNAKRNNYLEIFQHIISLNNLYDN